MANLKISELTGDTAPTADDLVVTVNDPGGTPATRKATITNLTKAIPAVIGDSGSGGTKGLVPAPAAGDAAAGKFLKADGTFAVPSGSGAETGANSDITSMDGLTGPLENPTKIVFPEAAAPSTPGANKVVLYAKSDGLLYSKDDAGTETVVTGGGGGGISGLTTDTIPKATSSTTIGNSILKQPASDTVLIDDGATRAVVLRFSPSSNPANPYIKQNDSDLELRNGSGIVPAFKIRTVWHDQGGSSSYTLTDTKLMMGPNSVIGWSSGTGTYSSTITTIMGVVQGGNPGQIVIASNTGGGGGTFAFGEETPSQITADQNDYTLPGMSYFVRLSSDASRNITGLRDPSAPFGGRQTSGEIKLLVNVGSFNIVLKHEDAASTAGNRFLNSTGADITLAPNEAADMIYDSTSARWRVHKRN